MLNHAALLRYFGILLVVSMATAVVVISPTSPTTHIAEAQTVNVCDRTQQVQDAIVAELKKIDANVTCVGADGVLGRVTRLQLRNSGIREFKAGDMQGLTDLTWLNFAENHVSSLPSDFFDDLDKLVTLNFANNNFTTLPNDFFGSSFDGKTTVTTIDASGNRIENVGASTFDGFTGLIDLNLARNDLPTIAPGTFDGLHNLIQLDLSANKLESLPDRVFHKMTSNGNACNRDGQTIQEVNFNQTFRSVELQRNKLTSLPDGVFVCLNGIYYVDLSYNELAALPNRVFISGTNMLGINLESNKLTALPANFVQRAIRLEILDLSDNLLTSLDGGGLHLRTRILELDISNNRLTKLPDNYVDTFLRTGEDTSNGFCLINLDMGGNPFSDEWIQSGKLNEFISYFGSYDPRGSGNCQFVTRWPGAQDRQGGSRIFGGPTANDRATIWQNVINTNVTGVESFGIAGVDLSLEVTDQEKSSWQLLLDEFASGEFDEIYEFKFGWEGLVIDDDMLDELPVQLERIVIKDATFDDNISGAAGEGFKRFDAETVGDIYNRIDRRVSTIPINRAGGYTERPAHLYWARWPIDTYTGFDNWFDDRGDGLQSLTLDNVGLTGDGGNVLDKLPKDSMRWLEIRNNPELTEINDNIKSLSNLYGLQIENNGIETISDGTFNGLSKLFYLGLGGNKITSINSENFDGLTHLQMLLLNDNELRSLHPHSWTSLPRLENLDLRNNDLVFLFPALFVSGMRPFSSMRDQFGEYEFPLEQINLDGNPGAPFHINVEVIEDRSDPTKKALTILEGAPYRFEVDILNEDRTIAQTLTIPEGTLDTTPGFDLPEGGSLGFLPMHPYRASGDNRGCLGLDDCYSGFEFKQNPPPRLIDIKLISPPQHYGVGEKLIFEARYSEFIEVTGSPTLSFTLANPPEKVATFVERSAANTLSFEYTVQESDVGRTGIDTSRSSLTLASGVSVTGQFDGNPATNTQHSPPERVTNIAFVPAGQGTATTPQGRLSTALIKRIEPSIRSVSLRSGEMIRLAVDAYGRQDALDNGLLDGAMIDWDDNNAGGNIDGSGSRITYTAPSAPGVYTITASLAERDCRDDAETEESECSATFQITVRRASVEQPEDPAPVNPSGVIPTILTDNRGNNYEVFTPVDGGSFDAGEGFSITASAGDVPNGEIIGVRMSEGGAASNLGMTHQRYTLGGNTYQIHVVDSAGTSVDAYILDQPAEVCIPLPAALSTNISKIAMAALNSDGTLTILSATTKIGGSTPSVCGNVSTLPSTVAAGVQGAPGGFMTPVPTPEPETPDTGATAPTTQTTLWLMLLGITTATLAAGVLFRARRRKQN